MDLWTKILNASSLPQCSSIADHLCAATEGGGGDIIKRIYNSYRVKYIPSESGNIEYVLPTTFKIAYVPMPIIGIEYIPSPPSNIEYIPSPTIKIELKCKP